MKDLAISILVNVLGIAVVLSNGVSDVRGRREIQSIAQPEPAATQPVRPSDLRKPTAQELLRIAALLEAMKKAAERPAEEKGNPESSAALPSAPSPVRSFPAAAPPPPPPPPPPSVTPTRYAASARPLPSDAGAADPAQVKITAVQHLPAGGHDAAGLAVSGYSFTDPSGAMYRLLLEQKMAVILVVPAASDDVFVFDGFIAWKEDRPDYLKQFATRSPPMPPSIIASAMAALRAAGIGPTQVNAEDVRYVCVHSVDQAILDVQRAEAARRGIALDRLPSTPIRLRVTATSIEFEPADATNLGRRN